MQRLFAAEKVGLFLDSFSPRIEKRESEEVKLLDLTLRLQPLTPELASALAGDGLIKKSLYRLDDGSPLPNIKSIAFNLSVPKQLLQIYVAPDTEIPSIALDQVEISDIRARTEKGVDGWGLVFYASFGPVSKTELDFVQRWYTEQQFVTFEEAQPSLDLEPETHSDGQSQATQDAQRSVGARQRTISHQRKGKPNGSIHGAEWKADCEQWRGALLTGNYAHWCFDWDGLPVDETTIEFTCCHCFDSVEKTRSEREELCRKLDQRWEFERLKAFRAAEPGKD